MHAGSPVGGAPEVEEVGEGVKEIRIKFDGVEGARKISYLVDGEIWFEIICHSQAAYAKIVGMLLDMIYEEGGR